jgi:hypothetical protein
MLPEPMIATFIFFERVVSGMYVLGFLQPWLETVANSKILPLQLSSVERWLCGCQFMGWT